MIQEYENTLRLIITTVLGSSDDTVFGVSEERVNKWKEKREVEQKKYKGILTEPRILYYSDIYDLKNIIDKNWILFKPILQDKKRFEVFYDEVEKFRNTIAHGRELFSWQKSLLIGALGDLKNSIITHFNKNMNAEDYFIKILKVSDSVGNIWERGKNLEFSDTKKILKVGQTIEFLVDAFDPKGREITYSIDFNLEPLKASLFKENNLSLIITKEMVARTFIIDITVSTEEPEYANYDTICLFYTVLP